MDKPSEAAKKLAQNFVGYGPSRADLARELAEKIDELCDAAKAEAYERAAQMADEYGDKAIAKRIRALVAPKHHCGLTERLAELRALNGEKP